MVLNGRDLSGPGPGSPSQFRIRRFAAALADARRGHRRGEDPLAAAYRELYEETGIRSVSLLAEAPDWINYDLPSHLIGIGLKGKYRGQRQRWYAFRFEGEESEIAINPPPGGHEPEFDAWEWSPCTNFRV